MKKTLMTVLCFSLIGCGTMNSDFSCKVTAGDSCLTIEQVDAMTRFADGRDADYQPRKVMMKAKIDKRTTRHPAQQDKAQTIWVAPWKDKTGNVQNTQLFYAGQPQPTTKG